MIADLLRPRGIADASAIPRLGRENGICLLDDPPICEQQALKAGAMRIRTGWWIPRAGHVRIDALEANLPRYARRVVVPSLIDLIPSTSWCASLANMLMASSWKALRDVTSLRVGGCQECGFRDRLECHEIWSYDEPSAVQRLVGFETLCSACHETRHLGNASSRGRYREALDRLALINRLTAAEARMYSDLVFQNFERRSRIEWRLDLGRLAGLDMRLKRDFVEASPGVLLGRIGRRSMLVGYLGVRCEDSGRHLVLR